MFEAAPYLQKRFDFTAIEAKSWLTHWMDDF